MEVVFWTCLALSAYAYFGYPLALLAADRIRRLLSRAASHGPPAPAPSVTILVPVHNEASVIGKKLENTLALEYTGNLEAIFISDGSTDETVAVLRSGATDGRIRVVEIEQRKGKANALNTGLRDATGEIVVFSDASIMLDKTAIAEIVKPFSDPRVGCASGEDYIDGTAGEGLYGRYELYLRDLESRLGSIVGASGSFYAQRKDVVEAFGEGLAPDFLSVLNTVEKGYRAVSVPAARGYMTALSSSTDEFRRKVRTIVRGMTALFSRARLLNPLRFPLFAFFLWSHKIMRWGVPLFLIGALASNLFLLDSLPYAVLFAGQSCFYALAALAYLDFAAVERTLPGRVALYFVIVNVAILVAWLRYVSGARQEIWTPTKRGNEAPKT